MKSSLLGFGGPIAGAGGKATHKLPAPSPAALPRRGARPRGEAGSHGRSGHQVREGRAMDKREDPLPPKDDIITDDRERGADPDPRERSEEHTSELQSLMRTTYAGFCLKKKHT